MTGSDQISSQSPRVHETFSQVYQQLVKSKSDIVGMIAYCLYKRQKKIYIETLASLYRKISRRSQRVEVFHKVIFKESDFADFRDEAELRLATYVKEFTDEAKHQVYRELAANKGYAQQSGREFGKSRRVSKWISAISASMIATIILGVFVDLDEYFPAIDPFPDTEEEEADASPEIDPDLFKIKPAAAPRPSNLPVM